MLITAGIALLISARWNEFPRGVKIAGSLALMLGFHTGGWYLREGGGNTSSLASSATRVPLPRGKYRKTGEALQLTGSCLFLANIALIGQIYNMVSRPPNALRLWWIGIAALPWLLCSKAQHVLLLLVFGVWCGLEVNERSSLIYCESNRQTRCAGGGARIRSRADQGSLRGWQTVRRGDEKSSAVSGTTWPVADAPASGCL